MRFGNAAVAAASSMAVLFFVLMTLIATALPVEGAGATLLVPSDDYPTIQDAIDAANDGDEIRVFGDDDSVYLEQLQITRAITLSGGWNEDFSVRGPGRSILSANSAGRPISITAATTDTVVTIIGFSVIRGDATGLGGFEPSMQLGDPGAIGNPGNDDGSNPLLRDAAATAAQPSDTLDALLADAEAQAALTFFRNASEQAALASPCGECGWDVRLRGRLVQRRSRRQAHRQSVRQQPGQFRRRWRGWRRLYRQPTGGECLAA